MMKLLGFIGDVVEGILIVLIIILGIPVGMTILLLIATCIGDLTGWYRLERYLHD